MNPQIEKLFKIANKPERVIIGIMSGTSLDGLDIALCRFRGNGQHTKVALLQFKTIGYDHAFKAEIKSIFAKKNGSLEKVCLLNPWVGLAHGKMILNCLKSWNIEPSQIDLLASHGQTIYHAPKMQHGQAGFGNATLQIGDGDHLAVSTGILTISDFRQKHIAAGGEGAPLAAYGDFLIFSKEGAARIMLNIGGITNFTYLPGSLNAEEVVSTDVGPGNTMMDAVIQKSMLGKSFDEDGELAKRGNVNESLLRALKQHSFFDQSFPKTTGPELFNLEYLENANKMAGIGTIGIEDTLATLNRFTSDMIVCALKSDFLKDKNFTVYSSGGGTHNPVLMENIKRQLKNYTFLTTVDLGIQPDAKEAVLFATLANECICGSQINFGSATNGIPSISLGKISFPQ